MEWRLSSRWRPRPEEALAWGSQSTRRTLRPSRARHAARLMAVVVLPTPPFWFTRPTILPMAFQSKTAAGSRVCTCVVGNGAKMWKAAVSGRRRWGATRWGGRGLSWVARRGPEGQKKARAVENYPQAGPPERWLGDGFHFGAMR